MLYLVFKGVNNRYISRFSPQCDAEMKTVKKTDCPVADHKMRCHHNLEIPVINKSHHSFSLWRLIKGERHNAWKTREAPPGYFQLHANLLDVTQFTAHDNTTTSGESLRY